MLIGRCRGSVSGWHKLRPRWKVERYCAWCGEREEALPGVRPPRRPNSIHPKRTRKGVK